MYKLYVYMLESFLDHYISHNLKSIYCLFFPSQAEFKTRVVIVRERMSSKEQEVTGKWLTEEKLKGDYNQ